MTTDTTDNQFEALLDYLRVNRGFDFTAYKRPSLIRRMQRRMETLGVESYAAYTDYLEVHPDEFAHLFNTLLINVTSFFRDQSSWDYLAQEIIPRILAQKAPGEPVRLWSAGCATGKEAYTAAMLMAEAMGPAEFRSRVKIYATDLSEAALNKGRQAAYTPKEAAAVPEPLRNRYLRQTGSSYTCDPDLRRAVIFGRHDLINDSPISRVDLLICRNTLIYFNAEAQSRVLSKFHYAVAPGGFLFLGKAEMLLTRTDLFTPVDLKRRVFARVPNANADRAPPNGLAARPEAEPPLLTAALGEAALRAGPVARVLVDPDGVLVMANDRAAALFGIAPHDIGRRLIEQTMSYRPVELRSCIDEAFAARRTVSVKDAEWPEPAGAVRAFDVFVEPFFGAAEQPLGVSVSYVDVSQPRRLRDELQQCNEERETAHEELQTTNEELQSTIEELETTNEELQSTNEELETMNEELQSTNEELRTSNDQLRLRGAELDGVQAFWRSVLASVDPAMVLVDRELRIDIWNRRAEEMWGLRADEVRGRHFLNLDIGLPLEDLRGAIRGCLEGACDGRKLTLRATNRRGKAITCRVSLTPLRGDTNTVQGVILLMDEAQAVGSDE